jgi:hypothetical protein
MPQRCHWTLRNYLRLPMSSICDVLAQLHRHLCKASNLHVSPTLSRGLAPATHGPGSLSANASLIWPGTSGTRSSTPRRDLTVHALNVRNAINQKVNTPCSGGHTIGISFLWYAPARNNVKFSGHTSTFNILFNNFESPVSSIPMIRSSYLRRT